MRINQGQEFVIGGYKVGTKTFDALIFGYYEGGRSFTQGVHETVSLQPGAANCSHSSVV